MAQGKNILIVEDNALVGKVMNIAFEKHGYHSRMATSAVEALKILEDDIPDIILSDYEMPGMNGFDFRQQLLQSPKWKNIPFIFLTAHSDEALVLKGLHLNALDYIVKGTPFPVIASNLDNILSSLKHEYDRSVEELKKAAELLPVNSIPKFIPPLPGFDVHCWNQPFQNHPGGDFMDYIPVNEQFTFLFLGDIMGKKWEAWFFTFGYLSYVRSAIRFCILEGKLSCLEILQKVNKVICQDKGLQNILSSLSLLLLDHENGTVNYTGAGDLPLIHYSKADDSVEVIHSSGLLLGLQEDGFYDEQVIKLGTGDKLLAVTDGLTDILVEDSKTSSFPLLVERLTPMLKKDNFDQIKVQLLADLSGISQVDDASLIFIERKNI